jgi:meso-butanediol dehydrogenase / (S,S)-butanediol dehydrogenase / diacetyl reductase
MSAHEGRVALVTGAASGIGRATARRLHAEGARVVAVDLDTTGLAALADLDGVATMAVDVTSPEDNARAVDLARSRFGGLDAACLNAGIAGQGPIDRGSMEDFDRMIDVNVRGVVLGIKACLPALESSPAGAVVVTGSVSGLFGDPGLWAYNASKGAVVNLVRSVALDIGHTGVRINAVCPGPVRTPMTAAMEGRSIGDAMRARIPLQRFGEPEEIAAVISFLASPDASFLTGAAVPVDGGVTAGTGQWATYGGRLAGYG